MVYEERNVWAGLIVSVFAVSIYTVIVLQQAATRPVAEVDWVPVMLWTIGGSIVATIVLSIVWGMLAGLRDPEGVGTSDQRDRDIAHMSTRVGQAFLVIAGLGVIVDVRPGARLVLDRQHDVLRLRDLGDGRRHRERRRLPAGPRLMVKPTRVTNTIRALREEAGLTQAELARRIGVTRQTLIAIEQGKYSPTLELAFQISREFGVSLDTVFHYPEA